MDSSGGTATAGGARNAVERVGLFTRRSTFCVRCSFGGSVIPISRVRWASVCGTVGLAVGSPCRALRVSFKLILTVYFHNLNLIRRKPALVPFALRRLVQRMRFPRADGLQ